MKKANIIAVLTVLLLLSACASEESVYEKAIADYVQTDKRGTWTDLQFKVVSLETADRTVADSIQILAAAFEAEKTARIADEEKKLAYWLGVISDNPKSREVGRYNENMAGINQRIDSLKSLTLPENPRFLGLAPDQVIGIVATCRYSFVMPGQDTRQERTDTFILSTDGKRVVGKEKKTD